MGSSSFSFVIPGGRKVCPSVIAVQIVQGGSVDLPYRVRNSEVAEVLQIGHMGEFKFHPKKIQRQLNTLVFMGETRVGDRRAEVTGVVHINGEFKGEFTLEVFGLEQKRAV